MNKLLLIDGNSLTYRAFYGTFKPGVPVLTNSNKQPINAILTFARMVKNAIETYEPTHILVAFDAGKKTVRHEKLDSYKAGRSKTPIELISQLPLIKEMLTLMGIKHFESNGIEADDIIGTIANEHCDDIDVMILSSDKDMFQLVTPKTKVIVPQNGNNPNKIIDWNNFESLFGYLPRQVPDIKGLVGDSSDNLPGVKGIGPKGALKLIQEYETLENIYKNIDRINNSIKEKLLESKKISLLCKEIATILKDVDVPYTLDQLIFENNVTSKLLDFFKFHGLKSLHKLFSQAKIDNENSRQISFENIVI